MRPADQEQVRASGGYGPLSAALASIDYCRRSGRSYAVYVRGKLVALFGVVRPDGCAVSIPWVLATTDVDHHRRTLWRASVVLLRALARRHPVLFQGLDARHTEAIRWARALGFSIGPAQPFGAAGLPFHLVEFRSAQATA